MHSKPRDVFLRIEGLPRYSPLAPVVCSRRYGRDCMRNEGHELGRIPPDEIHAAALDALVYREYLDPHYTVPNTAKLIPADVNEPPWQRRVPGALIWAQPGERLRIHVQNGDTDCHSFHLHGLHYGIDSDGAWPLGVQAIDGRRSDEILPGQRWTYVFDATEDTIGAWAFHDHVRHVAENVNRGLFGGLIVRDPDSACADHEVPVFVHQMVGTGIACNFKSGTVAPGGTFGPIPAGNELGSCRYHCQIHGSTMAGEIRVEAGAPTARLVTMQNNQFTPAVATVAPGGTVTWRNDEPDPDRNHIVVADGGGAATYCLNGRAYVGNTPTIIADAGERLRWYLFNLDLGGVWHNFHPHSARWQLPTPPGGASDVHGLSPVETFVAETEVPPAVRLPCALEEFQCDPPDDACRIQLKGDFLFHCHIEEHMMVGLAGLVRARERVWISDAIAKELTIRLPVDDGRNECPVVDLDRCRPRRPPHHEGDLEGEAENGHAHGHGHGGGTPIPATGYPTADDLAHAATRGVWELLPCDSQVLAVHAALLRSGKVLFFAGSGNDELYTKGLRSIVWDYENGTFHAPFTPMDFFCAGQAFLPDGRLLVAGGTKDYAFTGLETAFLFDPQLEEWIRVGDMRAQRWYPTLIALADGRVMAVAGTGPGQNFEVFSPFTGWSAPVAAASNWPLYPGAVLMANEKVFFTGVQFDNWAFQPRIYDVASNNEQLVGGLVPAGDRGMGTSILLPPAQDQRVMILGGTGGGGGAIANTNIVDLKVAAPAYAAGPPMLHPRGMENAVILPDRTVFVCGGGLHGETVADAELRCELYDPAADGWRSAATMTVPRLYHSVALLLPDGRVVTAGSNPNRRNDELRLELYHPPYLFKGARPFIESAPEQMQRGDTYEIETPQAREIKWAQLIRPMATTHSCETEQRLVDLRIARKRDFCRLRVTVPNEAGLVPPGWYMLFLTDRAGVPSVAHWVHIAR
jgi:FtsP/CotA-like multicopper oxidase with cupredoxin domain